ncbi:MAG: BTAD domain-containing putative transcriptional regulator [Gemmatimonadota bacterium]
MSKLEVLGTSNLKRHDDVDVQSVLQQPRRFALLVFLALATRKGPVTRDAVVGVFWPDSEPGRARGALSQALHYLRRSLGRNVIENVDQELLTVNRSVVSCDAVEFLDAVDAGRWRQAADLYAGDLLPGFFESSETVEFEHWLDNERRRLRQGASQCAWNLAVQAADAGETADAIVWARRTCEWSPNDEAEVRRLMAFMDRLGDRTGVIDAYERLKNALRSLDAEPSPETQDLVRTLRTAWAEDTVGTQQNATAGENVPAEQSGPVAVSVGESVDAHSSPRLPAFRPQLLRFAGAALLVAVVVAAFWGLRWARHAAADANPTILVDRIHSEAGAPTVAGALGDQIVTQLQSLTALNVVDGSDGEAIRRGRIDFVLRGGLLRAGERLQANIHLIDEKSGRTVASRRFERMNADSFATLDQLSAAIAAFTRRSIGAILEDRRIARADVPQLAIALVQLGRRDRRMADSLNNMQTWPAARAGYAKADSTFEEAASIAPAWNRPWIERTVTAYHRAVGRVWSGSDNGPLAVAIAREGVGYANASLDRSPGDVQTLEVRGLLELLLSNLLPSDSSRAIARFSKRAEADARRVTSVDPHRSRAWSVLGAVFQIQGDWNQAYWAFKRAAIEDTYMESDLQIILNLSSVAWEIGNMNAARQWCELAKSRVGMTWATASCEMRIEAVSERPDTSVVGRTRTLLTRQPEWEHVRDSFNALAAVLYARAGARAAARTLLAKTRPEAVGESNDLLPLEAWAWLELGNEPRARALLQRYVEDTPAGRGILRSRRFAHLNLPQETH